MCTFLVSLWVLRVRTLPPHLSSRGRGSQKGYVLPCRDVERVCYSSWICQRASGELMCSHGCFKPQKNVIGVCPSIWKASSSGEMPKSFGALGGWVSLWDGWWRNSYRLQSGPLDTVRPCLASDYKDSPSKMQGRCWSQSEIIGL